LRSYARTQYANLHMNSLSCLLFRFAEFHIDYKSAS